MRRESTGAHFALKLANSGRMSVGRARFKSPLAHIPLTASPLVSGNFHSWDSAEIGRLIPA